MLQLKNIVKTYVTGDVTQNALKGINITFRENEFVSILGQSGSGKTTMLNIIGGLDRYSQGDLVIDGVSTKKYKDSDWDFYRNNSIGFIFQSYNLIPHQSVLSNVEMAMTLAGVSKKERKEKAIEVLKKVGLGDHIHKKPNQMSGGQMQRVAIARALVNNPDILLADEPTGALDSETSIQIMELLKEIAKDKLVIMVTHNPELAQRYSTRIVQLLDGNIISDSAPYIETIPERERTKNKKISMSFLTALSLSFNNLRTKKGRTLLTAFAGSIGIIGIALVVSLSSGLNDYIASIQRDTMSSYPITISSEAVDMSDVMGARQQMVSNMNNQGATSDKNLNGIYAGYEQTENSTALSSSIKENDLSAFKKYLDDPNSEINNYVGEKGITYSYDLSFSVYSRDKDGNLVDTNDNISQGAGGMLAGGMGIGNRLKALTSVLGGTSSSADNFSEILCSPNTGTVSEAVKESYDVLYGTWPEKYNEVVLVLSSGNEISAETLYQLGFITRQEYESNTQKIKDEEIVADTVIDYSAIDSHELYLVTASDRYTKSENGNFSYIDDETFLGSEIENHSLKLKITGVIRPKSGGENATISTSVAYTSLLKDYIITHTNDSEVVKAQKANSKINVLNGVEFEVPDDNKKVEEAIAYIKDLDDSEKSSIYTLIKYYETMNTDSSTNDYADDISNMSDSEKAEEFDKWLEQADDEVLLALFDSVVSTMGALDSSDAKGNGSALGGTNSILSKLNDSFIGKFLSKITELFFGKSSDTTSNTGSVGDSAKIALIKQYAASLSVEQKAQLYTLIKNYNLDTADPQTLKDISSLIGTMQSGGIASGMASGQLNVASMLDSWLENSPDEEILIKIFDEYIGYSTYEDNMKSFGEVNYDSPSSISIYTDSFDSKDAIDLCIANYNETVPEDSQITYTDYVSMLTSSITTIIDTISYAIIAFVAISLVVSCIMIGIITHISVMERTKEIGILRALGASKHNISQVFNAETFIIGCCAGLLGIGISALATIPINALINKFTGLTGLSARLPLESCAILIVISIVITVIGGLLPAKKAAKKDPVIALRSE